MKTKRCISVLVIALMFLSAGIQTLALLQTAAQPSVTLSAKTSKTWDNEVVYPDGGGGDDVPGPGWPK